MRRDSRAGLSLLLLLLLPAGAALSQSSAAESAAETPRGSNDIFSNGFELGTPCFWTSTQGYDSVCVVPVVYIQVGAIFGHVRVEDVFITGFTADRKHLWVSDHLAAGYYEGVYVYRGAAATALGNEFEIGTLVDVEGDTLEFGPTPPYTLTELVASEEPVVAGPAGAGPTPFLGAPVAILADLANGAQFEGVLVKITDVAVTDLAPGDLVTLSDSVDSVMMDDQAFDYTASSFPLSTCFASVTGIMTLDTATSMRWILPRFSGDLALGGNCLPP